MKISEAEPQIRFQKFYFVTRI